MKQLVNKFLAISLTFAVLFSTSSFAADMHFCCSKLVDLSFFGKAKTCFEAIPNHEKTDNSCSLGQEECCSDQLVLKKGDLTLKQAAIDLEYKNIVFLQPCLNTYILPSEILVLNVIPFKVYDPPSLERDLNILYNTYLI